MATYIVLLGPPGAGKGTQATQIVQTFGLTHVSTGDLFRENLRNQTELGQLAASYMNAGKLVPDDVTIAMVRERITRPDCAQGVLFDGFPRTVAQADALSAMLAELSGKVDCVPYISVPAEVLVERLSGRISCPTCGRVYHVTNNPPKQPGVCDADGTPLIQREDDKPETVRKRIEEYLKNTAPLIDYYRERQLLVEIDGTQSIEVVSQQILDAIRKVKTS